MSEQTQSAAARYRAIRESRIETEEHFERVSPSGMTWILRRVPVADLLLNGSLPLAIATKMQAAKAGSEMSDEEAFSKLSFQEQAKGIELTASRIRYCCVSPKIVDEPETEDEIRPSELLADDFAFLVQWTNGGDASDGLETFRAGGTEPVVARTDRSKRRHPSKRSDKG